MDEAARRGGLSMADRLRRAQSSRLRRVQSSRNVHPTQKEIEMRSGTSAQVGSANGMVVRKADKSVRPTNKKIRRSRFGILAAAVAGVFAFRGAQAVDYSWDNTGTPGVAPAGGAGVWNTAGFNWT